MTREQAISIIQLLNSFQPYVPPILFNQAMLVSGIVAVQEIANSPKISDIFPMMNTNGRDKTDEKPQA